MAKQVVTVKLAEILGDLSDPSSAKLDQSETFAADGWGVAHVARRSAMIRGGLHTFEVHWYRDVATRNPIARHPYDQLGSIFVNAEGIYVRDDTLNMARLPLPRWGQMNAVWNALRHPGGLTGRLDWSTTLTHQWVRRVENGGLRVMREHLDPIELAVDHETVRDHGADVSTYQPATKLPCAGCGDMTTLSCVFCGRYLCAGHPWNRHEQGHVVDTGYLECQRPAGLNVAQLKITELEGR